MGAEPPKLDAEILGILEQRGKQLGINTRQSGDTSIVLTPSQSYEDETSEAPSTTVTEPTPPISTPALSINERLDRIKAAATADTVPTVYTEDEHATDVTPDHGATDEETFATTDMAAPSEETAERVDELPKIVNHIEFEDAQENTSPNEDVVEQPEVSAEDEAPEESPAVTKTDETSIDTYDGEDVVETAAEETEDQEPAVSEIESEAEQDSEEMPLDTVFADDAPEMDEFEAALT